MISLVLTPGYKTRTYQSPTVKRFVAEGPVRAARFVHKGDRRQFTIVHGSTKRAGWWQVSTFDQLGASGDTERRTLEEALVEVSAYAFELSEVVPLPPIRVGTLPCGHSAEHADPTRWEWCNRCAELEALEEAGIALRGLALRAGIEP